jgi:hypothetical protein
VAPASGHVLADADVPPDYKPIAVVRLQDGLFEMLELQDAPSAEAPGPGGGYTDIFDGDGRLLRRYTAIERANSKWQIIEYVRLSSSASAQPAAAPGLQPITTRQPSHVSAP